MKEKITCPNCGKEYDSDFELCPYCAEPKPVPPKKVEEKSDKETLDDKLEKSKRNSKGFSVFSFFAMYLPICFVLWINDWFSDYIFIAALIIDFCAALVIYWVRDARSDKEKLIELEFEKDETSICPKCGSHNVSLGRKGYDWKKGFWYKMFDIKGGNYIAGMDSRRVTGHCNSCGHSWETDQEWLK